MVVPSKSSKYRVASEGYLELPRAPFDYSSLASLACSRVFAAMCGEIVNPAAQRLKP